MFDVPFCCEFLSISVNVICFPANSTAQYACVHVFCKRLANFVMFVVIHSRLIWLSPFMHSYVSQTVLLRICLRLSTRKWAGLLKINFTKILQPGWRKLVRFGNDKAFLLPHFYIFFRFTGTKASSVLCAISSSVDMFRNIWHVFMCWCM